jgi:hypothetical protein
MPEITNFLAVLMAALLLPGCLPATAGRGPVPLAADLSLLVTVGDVTDSTAVLWLRGQSPGPMAASLGIPRPLDRVLNPQSLFSLGGIQNFGEVTVGPSGLTVRIVDGNGRVRFTHMLVPER